MLRRRDDKTIVLTRLQTMGSIYALKGAQNIDDYDV